MPLTLTMNMSIAGFGGPGVNDTGSSETPDTTNPFIVSTSPSDNDTGVATSQILTITFNENIQRGTGNITLRKNDTGFANAAVYNVVTDTGIISIASNVLTINTAGSFDSGTEYAVRIDATAIDDTGPAVPNSFAGISDDTTFSWTTQPAAGAADTGGITMGFQSTQNEGTTFDWIVDNTIGSDTGNTGTSIASPFETISAAVTAADTGDSIGVRNQGGVDYNPGGTLAFTKDNITLSGYAAEKPVITGGVDLNGAVVCDTGDEPIVGSNYANIFKVTGVAKSNFVDSDPFNAHLVENNSQMTIAMGRQPNPVYREIESYNLDWLEAVETIRQADTGDDILGHRLPSFTGNYTKEQIENCDIRFHRAPNGASRSAVRSFDTGTATIYVDDSGQQYESNIYRDRFALVNLVPAMQKGDWAFQNDTGSTVDVYFWPNDTGNVNSAVQYSNIDTLIEARTVSGFTLKSVIIQQSSATNAVGSDTPLRFDPGVGTGDQGPLTMHNCWSRNHYTKGDGYGHLYLRKHGGYSITQNTFQDGRNMFGVFLSGGHHDSTDDRTDSGDFSRNIVLRADKSPIRVYGNRNNIVSRNHCINSGLAAHANKGNNYEGGSKTLWADNFWFACSGYLTWQETDSQDFIRNWAPTNFSDGRAIVDQNRETVAFSAATDYDLNGDSYILNNDFAPTQSGAIDGETFNAIASLGNTGDSGVRFAVMNNITYGSSIGLASTIITDGWKNNVYTGGTIYDTGSDVSVAYTEVYNDVSVGNFGIDTGSPTRTLTGESLSSLPGTDGAITLAARWPSYDFTKDINNDTFDLANPPVGPAVNPDNYPTFDPVWVERPNMTGTPAIGEVMTMDEGVLMAINNHPDIIYQWCRVPDPYSNVADWPELDGDTGPTYTIDTGDVGFYVGCKISGGGAETQVIQTTQTLTTYPISIGNLLVEDHNDSGNLAANTWIQTDPFTYDGGPLLVFIPMHMDTTSGDPAPEVTIGDTGRVEGTGTSLTVPTDTGVANRSSNKLYYAHLISGDTGTVTLHYRVTAQGTDSIAAYAYAVPGMTGIGSYSDVSGTSSNLELETDVKTAEVNGIVLHMLVRQSISGTPFDSVTFSGAEILLDSGYSGDLASTNSTLFSIAQEDAASIAIYAGSASWTETRASGMMSLELRSDTGAITGGADVTAPTLQSTSPTDNDTGIATSSVLTGTFSENIQFGTGNITLRKNDTGFANAAVYDVATDTGRVSISGAVLTITPATSLDSGTEYSVQIDATAIDDTGPAVPNSFAGIADDTTWSFTTQPAAAVTDILSPYGDFSTDTGRWGYDAGQATITGGVAQFNTDTNFRGIFLEGLNRVPAPENTTLDLEFTISNFVSGSRVWINVQPVDTGGTDIGGATTIYDTNTDSGISDGTWSKAGAYTTPAGTGYLEISGFDAVVQPGVFDLDDIKLTYTS